MTHSGIANRVRTILQRQAQQAILSPIDIKQVLAVFTPQEREQARRTIDAHTAYPQGSVHRFGSAATWYAVRISLVFAPGESEDIRLVLHSLSRQDVGRNATLRIQATKQALIQDLGRFSIKWLEWGGRRSVELYPRKRQALKNNPCLLCILRDEIRVRHGLLPLGSEKTKLCHIVDRTVRYWDKVAQLYCNEKRIFEDTTTSQLIAMLKQDPWHSKYIVPLCDEHDRQIRHTLRDTAARNSL